MTREHDLLRDLVAPVALGAASPDEIARVEAHAADCPVCREELESLRAGADVLAVAVPQHEPSAGLRESLMATVRAEAGAEPAPAPPAPRRRRRWLPSVGMRPAVAALAAVAIALLGWNIALQVRGDGPAGAQVTALALSGTDAAPAIGGRVLYVPGEDTAVVRLTRLPALPDGEAYQLWVLRDGRAPRSAGLFEPTGPADAVTVATGVRGADGLAVTAQPRTSRAAPQGPILVQTGLDAA